MIVLGICLLIIAAVVPKLAVLWGIGIIVLVVGLTVDSRQGGASRRRSTALPLTLATPDRHSPPEMTTLTPKSSAAQSLVVPERARIVLARKRSWSPSASVRRCSGPLAEEFGGRQVYT